MIDRWKSLQLQTILYPTHLLGISMTWPQVENQENQDGASRPEQQLTVHMYISLCKQDRIELRLFNWTGSNVV